MTTSQQLQMKQNFKQIMFETPESTFIVGLSPQHATTRHSVKLTLHPSRIQLNHHQTIQINELNQKIQSLKLSKSDPIVFDIQIQQINLEIDHLHQRIEMLQKQIDSKHAECHDYEDQNRMVIMDMRIRQNEIDEMMKRRREIETELEKIDEIKQNHIAFLSNLKRTYGIINVDEGLDRLDEIDEGIERETLKASELRKLLAEKNRVQKGINFMNQSTEYKTDISPMIQEQNRLRHERHEIIRFLHELIEERKEIRKDSDDVYDKLNKMRNEKKELISELKEKRIELDDKYEERREKIFSLKKKEKDYENEVERLEDEKLKIFAEAEITTLKARDEQRKIKTANSLIHCLERFNQHENGNSFPIGKQQFMQDDLDMIARLRKPSKKERQLAKKFHPNESGQIPFDIETRKLFDIIGMPIPVSFDEIPATLKILRDMITIPNLSESLSDDQQLSSNHHDHDHDLSSSIIINMSHCKQFSVDFHSFIYNSHFS
jgi:uncharacterized coiled-coil DUF342 family protein